MDNLQSMVFRYVVLVILMVFAGGYGSARPYRARDLGIVVGILPTGRWNAITDVAGVAVGHVTLVEGDDVRTGVTVILPHPGNVFQEKVPAAVVIGNGFGKMVGISQIQELGEIETPIVLTNTLSVFVAADALIDYMLHLPGNETVRSINPVVAECNDGWLNNIRKRVVRASHVVEAIRRARTGPVEEGAVGAGTGMMALGWKGGIGTASRKLPVALGGWTVGVLVLANYGGMLVVDGVPVNQSWGRIPWRETLRRDQGGSAIIVIATDAPLHPNELRRLARRGFHGLARTGSIMSHGSGDYAIAFSTHPDVRRRSDRSSKPVATVRHADLNPLFQAVVEATEEAVYNALLRADTVIGYRRRQGEALPIDRLIELGRAMGRPWHMPRTSDASAP